MSLTAPKIDGNSEIAGSTVENKDEESTVSTPAAEPDPKRSRPNGMVSPDRKEQNWHVALFEDGTGCVLKTQQELFQFMAKKKIPATISATRIKARGTAMIKKHEQDYKQSIKEKQEKENALKQQLSSTMERKNDKDPSTNPNTEADKVRITRINPHAD